MKKRIMAFVLAVSMFVTLLSPAACEKVSAASTVTSSEGDFYHASEIYLTEDFKAKYYYMDDYFAKSSFTYQDSLATMSMCLSMAAFRSNRAESYKNKSQNLKALLKNCGFKDFEASDGFKKKPTETSTGTGIAHKTINVNGKKYTLIALAISGGCVEKEWGGILRIGNSGNGRVGQQCADNAYSFLKQYVKDYDISGNVKLWITGYGVGGGKANLLAGMIDKNLSLGNGVKIKREDMYAYCFQAVKLATTDQVLQSEKYNNIFNVCNPYNLMTILAASKYGMGRYGNDIYTPTAATDSDYASKRDAMLKKMQAMDKSMAYTVDDFRMKTIEITIIPPKVSVVNASSNQSMDVFLEDLVNRVIYNCASTRNDYVRDFEDELAGLMGVMKGNTDQNWWECVRIFVEEIQNHIIDIGFQMIFGDEEDLADLYREYAWTAIRKSGVTKITDQDVNTLADVLAVLAKRFATNYPSEALTFVYNMEPMFAAMEPVMNLAWLQSVDDNYVDNKVKNTITADSITKTVSSSKRTVSIGAKAKGDAKLSYKSNNSNITVNSSGKVTIKKNYIGKATITITAAAKGKYKKTTKKITVTVKPVKATITSLKEKNRNAILKNKKNIGNVKYQIRFADNKKLNNATKIKVSYNKGGYQINYKLKKGKTYFYQIRGYKTVDGTTIYGAWSEKKSVKVK